MGRKMCVKRYILGISLVCKAKLKKMLVGYLVEISMKGKKHQPVRLSNKGGKYLMSNGLGVGPFYWRSCGLKRIGPYLCGSCDLYIMRLECYRSLVLI